MVLKGGIQDIGSSYVVTHCVDICRRLNIYEEICCEEKKVPAYFARIRSYNANM